jgi:hypothetical protein
MLTHQFPIHFIITELTLAPGLAPDFLGVVPGCAQSFFSGSAFCLTSAMTVVEGHSIFQWLESATCYLTMNLFGDESLRARAEGTDAYRCRKPHRTAGFAGRKLS